MIASNWQRVREQPIRVLHRFAPRLGVGRIITITGGLSRGHGMVFC